jgi:hypothetical protein
MVHCEHMTILTVEAIVERGQIRLPPNVRLPDKAKVYVLVPDVPSEPTARVASPRLAHPEQAADFAMEVSGIDAGV